jgi:transposase
MQVEGLDTTVIDYINGIIAKYEQQIKDLHNQINKIKNDAIEYQNKYLEIKERYALLVYKRFVRSAERVTADDKQPLLFTPEAAGAETETAGAREREGTTEVKSYSRKKCGRRPLDPKLERRENTIDIPESEKTCACGAKLTRIGEETSEKLHIIEPEIYVEKIIRPKYACRCCEGTEDEDRKTVRTAPVPPSIIPRSIVSSDLLSWVIIHKFEDQLPYYRQEKQFGRIGVHISRQDMSNWQQQAFKGTAPLFVLFEETVKSGPVIQMDETQVQVMGEEGRKDTDKSWMWLARGGPPGKTVVLYKYNQTRAAYNAKGFLEGYKGYLQTDGYKVYDAALKDLPGIIHVGCFAHARRKFFEASKIAEKPQSAEEGIKHIRKLYYLENDLRSRQLSDDDFLEKRKAGAQPVLEEFRAWLLKRAVEVSPTSLLGEAVGYTLKQWDKLAAYLESPYLTPDNNACENAIRPFVMGRKSWMFCGSPQGAESSCGMYSLIETAKQNNIKPSDYLTALFERAPLASSPQDWEKLLPWNIFKP